MKKEDLLELKQLVRKMSSLLTYLEKNPKKQNVKRNFSSLAHQFKRKVEELNFKAEKE